MDLLSPLGMMPSARGVGELIESLCCHGPRCFGRSIVHLSGFCCFGEQCDIFGGNMTISIYKLLCGILELRSVLGICIRLKTNVEINETRTS